MPFDFVKFAFSAGELSPELHGRGDLEGFRAGFREGSNVVVDWRGGVRDRPGTRMAEPLFIDKSISEQVRLSTFSFNTDPEDNYLLVWRENSLMIVQEGGYLAKSTPREDGNAMSFAIGTIVLVHGADVDGDIGPYLFTGRVRSASTVDVPWKDDTFTLTTERVIAAYRNNDSPYVSSDLRELKFAQYRDELLITHTNYSPFLLRRTLDEDGFPVFTFEEIAFLDARGVRNKRAAVADRNTLFDSREGGIQWTVAVVDEEGREYPVAETDAVTTANVDIGKKVLNLQWDRDPIAERYRIYATAFKARFEELADGGDGTGGDGSGDGSGGGSTLTPLNPVALADVPTFEIDAGDVLDEILPAATGGTAPYSYSVTLSSSDFSFDVNARRLTGGTDTPGSISFTYRVTDAAGSSTHTQIQITIAAVSDEQVMMNAGNAITITYARVTSRFVVRYNFTGITAGNTLLTGIFSSYTAEGTYFGVPIAVPPTSAFTVTANGVAQTVVQVYGNGSTFHLGIQEEIAPQATVLLSYTVPSFVDGVSGPFVRSPQGRPGFNHATATRVSAVTDFPVVNLILPSYLPAEWNQRWVTITRVGGEENSNRIALHLSVWPKDNRGRFPTNQVRLGAAFSRLSPPSYTPPLNSEFGPYEEYWKSISGSRADGRALGNGPSRYNLSNFETAPLGDAKEVSFYIDTSEDAYYVIFAQPAEGELGLSYVENDYTDIGFGRMVSRARVVFTGRISGGFVYSTP